MSTRGLYTFRQGDTTDEPTTVYVHQDNYPDGAAEHLQRALKEVSDPSQLLDAFLRCTGGEVSQGHLHPDAEFKYEVRSYEDLESTRVRALELTISLDSGPFWNPLWSGRLHEFCRVATSL